MGLTGWYFSKQDSTSVGYQFLMKNIKYSLDDQDNISLGDALMIHPPSMLPEPNLMLDCFF
jgi:hypothetical protein